MLPDLCRPAWQRVELSAGALRISNEPCPALHSPDERIIVHHRTGRIGTSPSYVEQRSSIRDATEMRLRGA